MDAIPGDARVRRAVRAVVTVFHLAEAESVEAAVVCGAGIPVLAGQVVGLRSPPFLAVHRRTEGAFSRAGHGRRGLDADALDHTDVLGHLHRAAAVADADVGGAVQAVVTGISNSSAGTIPLADVRVGAGVAVVADLTREHRMRAYAREAVVGGARTGVVVAAAPICEGRRGVGLQGIADGALPPDLIIGLVADAVDVAAARDHAPVFFVDFGEAAQTGDLRVPIPAFQAVSVDDAVLIQGRCGAAAGQF